MVLVWRITDDSPNSPNFLPPKLSRYMVCGLNDTGIVSTVVLSFKKKTHDAKIIKLSNFLINKVKLEEVIGYLSPLHLSLQTCSIRGKGTSL